MNVGRVVDSRFWVPDRNNLEFEFIVCARIDRLHAVHAGRFSVAKDFSTWLQNYR